MYLNELQAELRHFAAERDWQPFHTPKNLTTALMVEAAELAEIFQWQTSEESRLARADRTARQRIGEEVADVMLYLLQVADHCRIDVQQAVKDKLAKNTAKYPAKRVVARVSPARATVACTHVLLDYENTQPSDAELRALVPDVSQVWVFHGPHQREVEKRFASFGSSATAVPISRSGKNALDFHLSFYMGYIASRNPGAKMVVVANDKGYEPMLEHARAMGFAVRRKSHGEAKAPAKKSAAKKAATSKVPAKKAPSKKVVAKKLAAKPAAAAQSAAKKVAAKKVAAKTVLAKKSAAAKKVAAKAVAAANAPEAASPAVVNLVVDKPAELLPDSAAVLKKLTANLRKMGDKRPAKPASLWRSLKSFLGIGATEEAVEVALARLIAQGVVKVDSVKGASYPMFDAANGSLATRV